MNRRLARLALATGTAALLLIGTFVATTHVAHADDCPEGATNQANLTLTPVGPGQLKITGTLTPCSTGMGTPAIWMFLADNTPLQLTQPVEMKPAGSTYTISRTRRLTPGTRRLCVYFAAGPASVCYGVAVDTGADGASTVPVVSGIVGTEDTDLTSPVQTPTPSAPPKSPVGPDCGNCWEGSPAG